MSGKRKPKLKLSPDWIVLSCDSVHDDKTSTDDTSPTRERKPSGSCLKSPARTPPGTPIEKKQVRFADAVGEDLVEAVHTILKEDSEVENAWQTLQSRGIMPENKSPDDEYRYLSACFPHPCIAPNFLSRVAQQKVCLENVVVPDLTVLGTVRVANIGYKKQINVRFTMDNWTKFYEIPASYVQESCDGETDRFSFGLSLPQNIRVGCRLEFAISYTVNGQTYWDNNYSKNYAVICYASTNDSYNPRNRWGHHFV
ncbi:glycogen-binding subunit 76A-like [Glandiceps talaboti]